MKREKRRRTRRKLMMDAENKGEDSESPLTKVALWNGASRSIIISYPSS
jgi:hypothetical protein